MNIKKSASIKIFKLEKIRSTPSRGIVNIYVRLHKSNASCNYGVKYSLILR